MEDKLEGLTVREQFKVKEIENISKTCADISIELLIKLKRSMPNIKKWMDVQFENDATKVTKFMLDLATVFDKYQKHLPEEKAKSVGKTAVNICISNADPAKTIDITPAPRGLIE